MSDGNTEEKGPFDFESVQKKELESLGLEDDAWKAGLFGVALSGGGIRSATFNLGVIQALSKLNLLRRVHYLSVVSGGSYIGGWLTALLHPKRSDEQKTHLFEELKPGLTASGDPEHRSIKHLRNFSNFLTPRKGLLTADTWSAIATYLRNVLLNQGILIAGLLLVFIGIWALTILMAFVADRAAQWWEQAFLVGLFAGFVGSISAGYNLASIADTKSKSPNGFGDAGVVGSIILPAIVGSMATCIWLPHVYYAETLITSMSPFDWLAGLADGPPGFDRWMFVAVLAGAFNAVVWVVAAAFAGLFVWLNGWSRPEASTLGVKRWLVTIFAGVVAALALGIVLILAGSIMDGPDDHLTRFAFIPPAILAWWFLVTTLHTGLVGTAVSTNYREWLSRLGAWMLMSALAWVLLVGLTLYGPILVALAYPEVKASLFSGWLLTTIGALLAGRQREGEKPGLGRRVLFVVAPYVFIVGLMVLLSLAGYTIVHSSLPNIEPEKQPPMQAVTVALSSDPASTELKLEGNERIREDNNDVSHSDNPFDIYERASKEFSFPRVGWAAALLLIVVVVLSWRVNINEFSLRNMYSNRLARCYLGASSKSRYAQPFTGFALDDDLPLCDVKPRIEAGKTQHSSPYLLVNTAVNIAKSNNLAWQERQAASFLLSPGYCGFETDLGRRMCPDKKDKKDKQEGLPGGGLYRRTDQFAARQSRYSSARSPLTLADAMAASGAAANPAMGFRSKTAYSILLALFNIRLGRWVGNPRIDRTWDFASPFSAIWYLIKEAFNNTSDCDYYLQLSDGGHFENLGLYALVKRQCRYIVCCDCSADKDYEFEDLGNAIRKCRIDLGVEIDIDVSALKPGDEGFCETPCAVGRVRYKKGKVGTLVYIKPCKSVDMPSDVINYAMTHQEFPHETTADQFFSESQFESYRALGYKIATQILGVEGADNNLARLFPKLQRHWYPSSQFSSELFTRHAAVLDRCFDRLRQDENLKSLDRQFYPGWRLLRDGLPAKLGDAFEVPAKAVSGNKVSAEDVPTRREEFRSCFYFCNSLIQLMENVFLDLNLRHPKQREHPDNRGWINMFRQWSWSGMFRTTWVLSAATYGVAFQEFCKNTLGLYLGRLSWDEINDKQWKNTRNYHEDTYKPPVREDSEPCNPVCDVCFNFVESKQIETVLKEHKGKIYRLKLQPCEDTAFGAGSYSLPVGYAIVDGGKLVMYRVQDHLRKMGLGRRGLFELLVKLERELELEEEESSNTLQRLAKVSVGSDQAELYDDDANRIERFTEMLNSVCQEWISK